MLENEKRVIQTVADGVWSFSENLGSEHQIGSNVALDSAVTADGNRSSGIDPRALYALSGGGDTSVFSERRYECEIDCMC